MSQCASCHAEIFWAISVNGSRMPIDAEPVADGNVLVSQTKSTGEFKCVVLARDAARPADRRLFVSHFSTCPNARQHRRNR